MSLAVILLVVSVYAIIATIINFLFYKLYLEGERHVNAINKAIENNRKGL